MTPEAQGIAIAEACGWTEVRQGTSCLIGTSPDGRLAWQIPNYLSDLNAMHNAEKELTQEQRSFYYEDLKSLCRIQGTHPCSATAAQRAEAFLRTLNLWGDSK